MIRQATKDDFEAVFSLLQELYPEDITDKEKVKQIYEQQIDSPHHEQFILEEEHQAIGYGSISIRLNIQSGGHIAELDELIVSEKRRGKGYGTQLLEYAETIAKSRECIDLGFISTFKRVKAHQFYESKGYQQTSRHFWKDL